MNDTSLFAPRRVKKTLPQKLMELNWLFVLLLVAIACVGFAMLYSVGGGSFDPWARQQAIRFGAIFILMLVIALVDLRIWFQLAYPAYIAR